MDLNDVRRKRLKLYEPTNTMAYFGDDVASDSRFVPSEDQKAAYELQKQYDQGYHDRPPPPPALSTPEPYGMGTAVSKAAPKGMAADERMARELQQQFHAAWPWHLSAAVPISAPAPPPPRPARRRHKPAPKPTTEMVAVISEQIDDSEYARAVRGLAGGLHQRCGKCHADNSEDLERLVNAYRLKSPLPASTSDFPSSNFGSWCARCKENTCLGCGHLFIDVGQPPTSVTSPQFSTHCDRGRLILIWLLLCANDIQAHHNKPKRVDPGSKKPPPANSARGDNAGSFMGRYGLQNKASSGIGYASESSDSYNGVGNHYDSEPEDREGYDEHGGSYDFEKGHDTAMIVDGVGFSGLSAPEFGKKLRPLEKNSFIDDPDDMLSQKTMFALTSLLPTIESGHSSISEFDLTPPKELTSLLLRSSILTRAAELLRNDSIEDVSRRSSLYITLINFVRALASHYTTSPETVHTPLTINRAGHHLMKVSLRLKTRTYGEKHETGQSLASSLRNLAIQSQTMLNTAEKSRSKDLQSDEAQQTLLLCRKVVDLSAFLQANAFDSADREDSAIGQNANMGNTMTWPDELAMKELPDDLILDTSYFGAEARRNTDGPAGRMRHLIKEITCLKTSLPPGIFVRYGSSRLDVMKIMIVGPQGTPYEGGLFEFDLFCGLDFPHNPPEMKFRTTGHGVTRFNPNLYEDGKVCLSLIDTWEGEPWRPGKSTILQVLVSLQAMVLCDEPHCNEPGHEDDRGTIMSKMYNQRLYPQTVKHAMLEWLEKQEAPPPTRKTPRQTPPSTSEFLALQSTSKRPRTVKPKTSSSLVLWEDVVKKHFEVNGELILKAVEQWVNEKSKSRGKRKAGKPVSDFTGTGWSGRTLGEDMAVAEAVDFIGRLKWSVKQLEQRSGKAEYYGLFAMEEEEVEDAAIGLDVGEDGYILGK